MNDADILAFDHYLTSKLHDAEFIAWKLATECSAMYINRHMHEVPMFSSPTAKDRHDLEGRNALLGFALQQASPEGLRLEFGVHEGSSIAFLASQLQKDEIIHGFDSFEGLPEEWFFGRAPGRFSTSGVLPTVPANVRLHKGWFSDTLPAFLRQHAGAFSFVHIDSDLYVSAKQIFAIGAERFVPGTVIVFDEYFNYPGWEHHEYRAFQEFIAAADRKYKYLGCAPRHYSVAVKLLAV